MNSSAAQAPRSDVAGSTAPRSAVVVNPTKVADLDARRREICDALAAAGWPEPLWLETSAEDPGRGQTRQALEAGVDVVFAFGGDGTVMACVTELAGPHGADGRVALAVLPSGTGNLLATNLALPDDPAAGVALATGGGRRLLDVGEVEDRCFAVMAGMGFDALMLDDAAEGLKARVGWLAYLLSGLRHLRDRPMRVSIRIDGGPPLRRRARTIVVGNVGRLQAGLRLLAAAEPDDGVLDVAVLTPHTLRHWLSLGWAVLRRRPRVPRMETFQARRIDIASNRIQPRELDGDVIEPGDRMTVNIRPRALCLCVPADDEPGTTLG